MLDRRIAPAFIQSYGFNLIKPESKRLANGIDLHFINGGDQDVIKIEFIFKAGRWFEDKAGQAHFAASLLSKGTTTKNSFQIAQLFDQFGAHLEINPGLDFVSVSLYTLSRNVQPVLSLVFEILTSPVFPKKEIEQSKSIYLQNLKVNLEKTSFLASKIFRKSLFGANHPYGKELEERDVVSISRTDLANHYQKYFSRPDVFVSGKIEPAHQSLIVETLLEFPAAGQFASDRSFEVPAAENQYAAKDDAVQSSIRMGLRSLRRSDPDYFKAVFASHLLGGYFGSRLMKNIREEKGLTYGIYASLHPLKNNSYLTIGTDVNKDSVSLTVQEIRKELQRLRTEPVPMEELETARNHFIGSLQSEITTPFAHADKWKTIKLFALPSDYYQNMIHAIQGFSQDDIIDAAEKHFNERDFIEVAVG